MGMGCTTRRLRFYGRRSAGAAAFLMHIPKTAGTSLLALVEREYDRDDHCAIYPGWPEARGDVVGFAASRGGIRAVIGHFFYGLHEDPLLRPLLPPRPAYATILRDPARRVVSLYNYVAASDLPAHRAIAADHPTLESFLDHPWARDAQAAFLLGDVPPAEDPQAALVARLGCDFAAVGLAERFDESVVLIASTFGWRLDRRVSPRNVGRPSSGCLRFEDLDDRLVGRIREVNRLDQLAYDFVRDAFDARCAAVPGFRRRLERYRRAPALSD